MNYRPLGHTVIKVNAYCLGTMMFGKGGNPDHDECIRMIHKASVVRLRNEWPREPRTSERRGPGSVNDSLGVSVVIVWRHRLRLREGHRGRRDVARAAHTPDATAASQPGDRVGQSRNRRIPGRGIALSRDDCDSSTSGLRPFARNDNQFARGALGAGGSSRHHHCVGNGFTRGHISLSVLPS